MSITQNLRTTLRRLVVAAAPAALVLATVGAGHAAAIGEAKYGTVAVVDADSGQQNIVGGQPRVCSFYFEFDMNVSADVLGWKVKEWNAAPFDGLTVLKGQGGPTDAAGKLRVPDSGSLTLPNGRYNVIWDDEYPPDGSAGVQSFVVDCQPKATPTPTPTPTSMEATPSPTEEAIGGTQPTGSVLDLAAAGGGGITAPPTDTTAPAVSRDNDLGALVAAVVIMLATLVGALAVMPRGVVSRASRRR
jgi:hypothetical protein